MDHLIWIYAVCKSLLLSPVAVKELKGMDSLKFTANFERQVLQIPVCLPAHQAPLERGLL